MVAGFPIRSSIDAQDLPTMRLGVMIGADVDASTAGSGVALGIREAQHAALLFNRKLVQVAVSDPRDIVAIQALVFAGGVGIAGAIAGECTERKVLFLNAVTPDDSLRRQHCTPFTFHVSASVAMRDAALAAAKSSGPATAEMWHPGLRRFGAAQLNDRFGSGGGGMTSNAWAGWMAVKIAWETFLRVTDGSAIAMAANLTRDSTNFDGHKGAPLSFRHWDHQLRQPLYVVPRDGTDISEIPSLSRSDIPMRELLDTIGDERGGTACGR